MANELETDETPAPVTVKLVKETEKPQPNFDYDDYTPTEKEIEQMEVEIDEQTKKRTAK